MIFHERQTSVVESKNSGNKCFKYVGNFLTFQFSNSTALRFLDNYTRRIECTDYTCSHFSFFHPHTTLRDATGTEYVGGPAIYVGRSHRRLYSILQGIDGEPTYTCGIEAEWNAYGSEWKDRASVVERRKRKDRCSNLDGLREITWREIRTLDLRVCWRF